ncbi:MAG TPA: aspartyl/asparaginyl beta-hydroxylase domain-containing protein [Chloroflexota bacterium]|nr:aspartyl/asparaginyl beta-hydroxylase domain-containing protein [Chloroflexota bacterium]
MVAPVRQYSRLASLVVLFLFIRRLERLVVQTSKVEDRPYLPADQFPWVKRLEDNWRAIREELDGLLPYMSQLPNFHDISPDQRPITSDDGWKTFFFYGFGVRSEQNCLRCPRTAELIAGIPGMVTAFFSILAPGKYIPPHRGPYKGVLRCHLALLIPDPPDACGLRVGGQLSHWQEGRSVFFDDTYLHEAWNYADSPRAVLFLDVLRPTRFPGPLVNRLAVQAIALSPYVRTARSNELKWERAFETVSPADC